MSLILPSVNPPDPTPMVDEPVPLARTTLDTRSIILQAGLELILKQGYHATGLNELLRSIGVPKGSFYHYFASKEVFAREVLLHYEQQKILEIEKHLGNKQVSPLNRFRLSIVNGMKYIETSNFEGGCLIGSLAQEMSSQSAVLAQTLAEIWQRWQDRHLACATEAQQLGELGAGINLTHWVESYAIQLQGAIMDAKMCRSLKPFRLMNWLFFVQLAQPAHLLSLEEEAFLALT
jgi:TetR/AcrR family transcriptional repressor of nem operon